jgi:hypothetical protein
LKSLYNDPPQTELVDVLMLIRVAVLQTIHADNAQSSGGLNVGLPTIEYAHMLRYYISEQ